MMIKKEWEVRHGFDPIGVLGFVASVDTYRTQAQAKARVRELHDTGIVPAGERVEVRYIGEDPSIFKGATVSIRAPRLSEARSSWRSCSSVGPCRMLL